MYSVDFFTNNANNIQILIKKLRLYSSKSLFDETELHSIDKL